MFDLLGNILVGGLWLLALAPYAVLLVLWLKHGSRVFTDEQYFPHDDRFNLL